VTTSQKTASALEQQLKAVGVTVVEIGLWGRFHCECYRDDMESLLNFCDSQSAFQFPDASSLVLPTRSNSGGDFITHGKLHHIALRAILLEQSEWYRTFAAVQFSRLKDKDSRVVSFGPERCIPSSLMRGLSSQITHFEDLYAIAIGRSGSTIDSESPLSYLHTGSGDDIAVIGMSCNVTGAGDLEEFWKILVEGKSQHKEVPGDRFGFETAFRDVDSLRKWYGNFINNHDAFDHKFFKKAPREAASMDPQQRLLMQIAYQAVEQSGYFQSPKADTDKHIGCYIGVCATDYENNIACHPPNAFSATGNLRSFIAGKISHYFGWTGPGLTIDTACSASAVAIHQACKAILSGECTAALAGGTNMMTQPLWFQNLAAASFLSPTGQCKPFDAKADGYCRGEAVATVFLKKMSSAIADGDLILGTISSTAVYQNQNCTQIFVPNAPSLSDLFRNVIRKAGLEAKQISVVEAHGTGTPVGDPAEYDSIRQVFGGIIRPRPLQFGSVKGLVGHTEGSSGVVSLIKVLLMIQEGYIPPQASFSMMNPSIKASPSDNMEISTSLRSWDDDFRAAVINNYGASGSNASMVVTQAPQLRTRVSREASTELSSADIKYPFWFCGLDDRSIRAYATRFHQFLRSKTVSAKNLSIANLAFNVSRQSNRSLDRALIFSCHSIDELDQKLAAFKNGDKAVSSMAQQFPRPVILCFGGQISTFVGLDRQVYDNVMILRSYLDQCDSICRSLGIGSIYPGIFQREPTEDPIKLQVMLFAMQYSSARSWIDCGIQPSAVVGHSFGELTALCISGVLNLRNALKLIFGRSSVIRDSWGTEKGSMMAVEADLNEVEKLLAESSKACKGKPATIACFNGPRSFTLAGSAQSIEGVAETISTNTAYSSIKSKRLNVTNAFHSTLVEPLMADLEQVGQGLTFNEPSIPLERATEAKSVENLTPRFVAEHMRYPVYFNHAVQRLSKQYPSSVWLEAGSNSTITTMASRALGSPRDSHFQPVNITSSHALQQLIDTTMSLWKAGLRVTFWAHSTSQTYYYAPVLLPPYQFDKQRHWMEFKKPPKMTATELGTQIHLQPIEEVPNTLWTFMGYQDSKQHHARFRINTMIKKYEDIISGHIIAQTAPICPATLQVNMAIEAIMSLHPDFAVSNLIPQIRSVNNQAPICIDPSRSVWLDFEALDADCYTWHWKIISNGSQGAVTTTHVTGEITFRSVDDPRYQLEFGRYERLVEHGRCLQVLDSNDADDIIQGRSIYKIFSEVVDYGEMFFGLQKLVGKGKESAGRVVKKRSGDIWLDPYLGDCFCQVGGIWVNCMTDKSPKDMYIANGFEQWVRSPMLHKDNNRRPEVWHVFAHHHRAASSNAFLTDIFVFDSTNGVLMEVILGINYAKVSKLSMSKLLSRLTAAGATKSRILDDIPSLSANIEESQASDSSSLLSQPSKPAKTPNPGNEKTTTSRYELSSKLKVVLADISGLEAGEIKDDVELADIGIDSLMGMEMAHDIEDVFKCTLSTDALMEVTNFKSLLRCLQSSLGLVDDGAISQDDDREEESSEDKGSSGSQSDYTTSDSTNATSFAPNPPRSAVMLCASDNPPAQRSLDVRNGITSDLNLPASVVLEAFGESKGLTDQFIEDYRCSGYLDTVMPKQTQLCVALTVEAFKQLGCDLESARASQRLERILHLPEHGRLAEYLYMMLEETRVIDIDGPYITRTAVSLPSKASDTILQDLIQNYPDHTFANQLTYWTGSRLADVLTGKADGLKLIFGSEKGRELVSGLYGDSLLNKLSYKQMADFLNRLVSKLPKNEHEGPLKILEMGAGTGGTTKWLVPLLSNLDVSVEYTFTDLSSSFVAAARKRFKEYPFMKFRVHDIEKPPANEELFNSQHIVIASNAIHATHSLTESTKNIRKMLRPDGFLMILEMTETLYWVDVIFGVLEGWWLFDDGRRHAIAHQSRWEQELQSAGYGHIDWTDGSAPEVNIQRIFIALASGPRYDRLPITSPKPAKSQPRNHESRQAATDEYVQKSVLGFSAPVNSDNAISSSVHCVLVTGATGSLGSHLVAHFASLPDVDTVICLNRRSSTEPRLRQQQAFESKGIFLDEQALSKLKVLEADTAKHMLGLPQDQYEGLLNTVSHILHNAWPMSGKRPLKGFELQFQAMRNLIDFARDISCRRARGSKVSFQFISSIATVGHYPLWTGNANIPEERMTIESVLPNGYGDAKFVCERMLDETLQKYPEKFRAMTVRLGQVAGSKTSGYWNHMEHFSFLIKSSQTLKALPGFDGELSWTPVNDVAATLGDLLVSDTAPYPIYHIDNPVRQPWREMIPVLTDALGIPREKVIPFHEWIRRVRAFPGSVEWDNPAAKLVEFLDEDFVRMSCGGVLLDTTKSREHSKTLRSVGPVGADVARKYIQAWRDSGFLYK
jgi:acyl transferase domain-containing protein/nucleoside-diphosphate-sugar epimerase/SAM-dependent methyltransferase/acyl carrier protein